jgi:hypothetical protein
VAWGQLRAFSASRPVARRASHGSTERRYGAHPTGRYLPNPSHWAAGLYGRGMDRPGNGYGPEATNVRSGLAEA